MGYGIVGGYVVSIHISDRVTLLVDRKEIKGIAAIEPEDENLSVDIKWPKDGLSNKGPVSIYVEYQPTPDVVEFLVKKHAVLNFSVWLGNAITQLDMTPQSAAHHGFTLLAMRHKEPDCCVIYLIDGDGIAYGTHTTLLAVASAYDLMVF